MSDDDIAEIRARHEQVPSGNLSIAAISLAHADRATLLAEVERQRAEIERLRAMLPPTAYSGVRSGPGEGSWSVFAGKVVEERDAARAEVERLRAEIERLKLEPELLRAELISLANAARKALADAYDRAREGKP